MYKKQILEHRQIINRQAIESGFFPSPETVRETARQLFQDSQMSPQQWLEANKLNQEEFAKLMIVWTRISMLR